MAYVMRLIAFLTLGALLAASTAYAAGGGASKAAPSDDRAAKRISTGASYVHGPTIVTTLTQRLGAPRASVTVELGWDVPDAALRARMQLMRPRLNNATREALAEYVANRHRAGAQPNLAQMTQLLQIATDQAVGQAGARVLLANVVILDR